MAADLQDLHAQPATVPISAQLYSRLSKVIALLYAVTLLVTAVGVTYALYQNWVVRVEAAKTDLSRSASMGNFLVETALISAANTLDEAQALFAEQLQAGPLTRKLAYQLLRASQTNFQNFNKSNAFGLLYFVDRDGTLYEQSSGAVTQSLDLSDRTYFYALRDHPEAQRTVGPLVVSRTTGNWVFHMSVPLYGQDGQFVGVLVQQIIENDIAAKLRQYADTRNFEQLVTHYDGFAPSFVYPPPGASGTPNTKFLQALRHQKPDETKAKAAVKWDDALAAFFIPVLEGSAVSPTYALATYASVSVATIRHDFWADNTYLLVFVALSLLFVTSIYKYLFNLSRRLAQAQDASLHDELTALYNRRALDETLPRLLRESMRSQTPVSLLFIDIDHFRHFNENYGHESGDMALTIVAKTLLCCARRPLDFVCRWGGEEFVLVLPKTSRNAALGIAEKILHAMRAVELQSTDGRQPKLTVSVGHVTATMSRDCAQEDLVDYADKAMLMAKSRGRNQSVEYLPQEHACAPAPGA